MKRVGPSSSSKRWPAIFQSQPRLARACPISAARGCRIFGPFHPGRGRPAPPPFSSGCSRTARGETAITTGISSWHGSHPAGATAPWWSSIGTSHALRTFRLWHDFESLIFTNMPNLRKLLAVSRLPLKPDSPHRAVPTIHLSKPVLRPPASKIIIWFGLKLADRTLYYGSIGALLFGIVAACYLTLRPSSDLST